MYNRLLKHIFVYAVAVCLLLCLPMVSLAETAGGNGSQFSVIAATQGTEAAWELVSDIPRNRYMQQGYAHLSVWSPDSPVTPGLSAEKDTPTLQCSYSINIMETNGTGFTITDVEVWGYDLSEDCFIRSLMPIKNVQGQYVPAYGMYTIYGMQPAMGNFHYHVYAVYGVDDNGHEQEFYGLVEFLNYGHTAHEMLGGTNAAYDTHNLRSEADFEVEVAQGVWWVPAISLGSTDYSNYEIAAMVNESPETKQASLNTLYEALQLFQVGNFSEGNDNVRIIENDIDWEHHKPGYHAVRTNTGCCASDTSWLNYILRDDYEEVGTIAYSNADGSGHIFNYIFHEGFYYFIDLTHYRTDFQDGAAVETGFMSSYYNSDFIAGAIHKTADPEAYIQYFLSVASNGPALFFLSPDDECPPATGIHGDDGVITIVRPDTAQITAYPGDQSHALRHELIDPPQQSFDWAALPDARFIVDENYLTAPDTETAQSGLWQPGQVLPLQDHGQRSQMAQIDGEEYQVVSYDGCRVSYEETISQSISVIMSYWDNRLNLSDHAPALAAMENVRIGEVAVEFAANLENTQLAVCTQKGDSLVVQEVVSDTPVYYQPMYIYRDENGLWQQPETYWYLLQYDQNGETHRVFGRFLCQLEGDAPAVKAEQTDAMEHYQIGETLSLVRENEDDLPVIEGVVTQWAAEPHTPDGLFTFYFQKNSELAGEISLAGGKSYTYYDFALPLASCQAKLEQLESLCIGDVVIECADAVMDPQIYVCVREGDSLIVQDVICADQYQSAFLLERDENGQWQKTQDCWYLMQGQVAGLQFRVAARMFCDVDTGGLDLCDQSE